MANHNPKPSGDPRIINDSPFNETAAMETHLQSYLKNFVMNVLTDQEILQRDESNRMIATPGFGFALKKKSEEGFIVGDQPAE